MKKILLIILSLILMTIFYWAVDATIDYYMFKENISYENIMFHELLNKIFIVICFFTFNIVYYFLTKKASKEIKDKNRFINEIILSVNEGVVVYDEEFNILLWNKYMEDTYGYKLKEVLNKNVFELFPDLKNTEIEKNFKRALKGEFVKTRNIKYPYRKSGDIIVSQSEVCPHISGEGKIIGIISIVKNITEEIKQKEIIKLTTIELKHKNEELEQFAYVASHDLQEPLRVVSSYCQLLKEKCHKCENVDDETKKWLNYTIDATDRMKTLIKELLDFSRVGRKDEPFEKVDLNEIVEEVKNDFEILIKETNTIIVIEEKLPYINCIKFRIRQLIYNLISNSIKFAGEEAPLINISFCEEKGEWLFCIKDNGIGIDSKYYDRIFEIFKRLYSREEYPGTGIGLALCKKIVETHNGKIWVDSVVNKGSLFYFTLPKSKYIN